MANDLKRTVVWKNLLLNGADYCALWRTAEGWLLEGAVVGVLKDQRPGLAHYEIDCDENWLTHRVQVERTIGNDVKSLSLTAWVKFPELTVQTLSQRYIRLANDAYRYQSNTGFSAEIAVDDLGLVITYPSAWERLATL